MEWGPEIINTAIQLLSISAVAGMGWIRLQHLERDLRDLKDEMAVDKDVLELKSRIGSIDDLRMDMAVIKAKLTDISDSVKNLTSKDRS